MHLAKINFLTIITLTTSLLAIKMLIINIKIKAASLGLSNYETRDRSSEIKFTNAFNLGSNKDNPEFAKRSIHACCIVVSGLFRWGVVRKATKAPQSKAA
jgi:hypothetical protein